ncbi:MAG: ATP-binding cassette domain-containing protein [Candidatus Aminicenantes bacterium]|jgi:ABC-type polar amino acid transport system ATPase subunit
MLKGRGLKKRFGSVEALRGVDISVRPGKITLLVGPSGSGKTTLLKCLAFLERPDSGIISFNGNSFTYPDAEAPKESPWPELTVVFQQHFLWPHLTIRENILLPIRYQRHTQSNGFEELVALFEMEDFIDRHPNQVSLGQRQRAALARALVINPKMILMDEITSALDVEQIGKIAKHLLELRSRGIGILLITHLLDFARGLLYRGEGDVIVFLDKGEVLEAGGHEVLVSPKHPRVVEFISQMEFTHRIKK